MKCRLKSSVLLSLISLPLAFPASVLAGAGGTAIEIKKGDVVFPEDNPPSTRPAGPLDPEYVKTSQANPNKEPRQMEKLGRGVVALNQGEGKVWVSWRMLGTEPDAIAFNVYRSTAGGAKVKLNAQPIGNVTFYQDSGADITKTNEYFVRPVIDGKEGEESKPFLGKLAANAPVRNYIEVPLRPLPGYSNGDASVGDLDGDGEYEIVLHRQTRSIDSPSNGFSGEPVFEAYKMDGTFLWQINLGKNVREGEHYTQFMVYDLDGDGRAEFVAKTAPGTVDGAPAWVLMAEDKDPTVDYRDDSGHVQSGPEYLTVFDGPTGKARATVPYIPDRGEGRGWGGNGGNGNNDNGTNRRDRYLATIAYLDGVHPSVVMCRGYYGRSVLAAWDFRDGKLTSRWVFDSQNGDNPYSGQGSHYVTATDADGDGRDEIVYHSMIVDDNGKPLFSTGLRHGDAMHVGDFSPSNPGIEVFGVHESEDATARFMTPAAAMYDAKTGKVIWSANPGVDAGRGVAADIDPRFPGAESWGGAGGLISADGERIGSAPGSTNFVIYWDGDLYSEILDGGSGNGSPTISKWNAESARATTLLQMTGTRSNNGSKSVPALSADLFGDWREEAMYTARDNNSLRIYVSDIPTEHRLYTLMHDPQYRLNIASQNVAYNQPPHLDYDPVALKGKAPKPNIVLVEPKPAK